MNDDVVGVVPDAQGECASPGPAVCCSMRSSRATTSNLRLRSRSVFDERDTDDRPEGCLRENRDLGRQELERPLGHGCPRRSRVSSRQRIRAHGDRERHRGRRAVRGVGQPVLRAGDHIYDGGLQSCGSTTCSPGQVCVETQCCPSCKPVPEGGACPPATTLGRCSIGGFSACLGACTAPPARCASSILTCSFDATCACLVQAECGSAGGSCGHAPAGRAVRGCSDVPTTATR